MTLPIIFLLVLVNGTMENMLEQMENEEWVINIPKIIIKERKKERMMGFCHPFCMQGPNGKVLSDLFFTNEKKEQYRNSDSAFILHHVDNSPSSNPPYPKCMM
eukprot:TRINITY_DN11306_c0_g2_i1.p2 TRINITY_DN11306_c0_g2~~TRINITY_DN11306_c0_g2_i1.p2  ORF type:complete len:103 (-),score=11.21 TRINITY_DN11306_c0_g2_i1:124-432(-)